MSLKILTETVIVSIRAQKVGYFVLKEMSNNDN